MIAHHIHLSSFHRLLIIDNISLLCLHVIIGCTFKPERESAKVSDQYLKKLGRSKAIKPEDFMQYKRFKDLRNDQRRQILNELETKELTFRPQLNVESRNLLQRKGNNSTISNVNSTSRLSHSSHSAQKHEDLLLNLRKGIPFILESEHPYRHNIKKVCRII